MAPTPFEPSLEHLNHMPEFSNNDIPRYLFRVHTPVTAVRTTTSYVIPPAAGTVDHEARLDIFRVPPERAGRLLWKHLTWIEGRSNLTSWTSSLLFALQYGLYRHRSPRDKSKLSEIHLLILDTREYPQGTFVKDLEIMRAITSTLGPEEELHDFLNFRENTKIRGRKYYFGEYLSQGDLALEGRCSQATMATLIDLGLFHVQPDLGDEGEWRKLADRVLALRDPFENPDSPLPPDKRTVRKAIVIASVCFGDRFALPVAVMLLALRPRRIKDVAIVKGLAAMFTRKCLACFLTIMTDSDTW